MELDKSKIISVPFTGFIDAESVKKQIVLHHTAGPDNANSTFSYWQNQGQKVATCIVMSRDGEIHQGFPSAKWAHHLGVEAAWLKSHNLPDYSTRGWLLDRESIAIEICNWGFLKFQNNNYVAWPNDFGKSGPATLIPASDVQVYEHPFRGSLYFHKYTPAQVESTKQLLQYWGPKYNIPLKYNEDMWDISMKAINSTPGVWTHCSFRADKSDLHPQPEMLSMLRSL